MESSPGREILRSAQEASRDQLDWKEGEHTRGGKNSVCRGPPKWKKNVPCWRNRAGGGVVEGRGKRRVWGEAHGAEGPKWRAGGQAGLCLLSLSFLWGRDGCLLGPALLEMRV